MSVAEEGFEDWDPDDDGVSCFWCGGEGIAESDSDNGWSLEDCPAEENHYVTCSPCKGTGLRKNCSVQ